MMGEDLHKRVEIKECLLDDLVYDSREAAQIEFQRRRDLVRACKSGAGPVIERMEALKGQNDRKRTQRTEFWQWAVVLLGGAIYGYAGQDSWLQKVGELLLLMGGFWIAAHFLAAVKRELELRRLRDAEEMLRFHWLAAGATHEDWWTFRKHTLAVLHLTQTDHDEAGRQQLYEARMEAQNEELNIDWRLLWRASGIYRSDWPRRLEDVKVDDKS